MAASTHHPRLVGQEATGHSLGHARGATLSVPEADSRASFDDIYKAHFAFVWRSVRRLGVGEAALDDVVQEVFVIVHRRLEGFEGRSAMRTWLFGIALRVARDYRRSAARRVEGTVDPDSLDAPSPGPAESIEKSEAVRILYALLDEMDDDRREIFVMAELEQIPMADVAATLGLNINTAHARLRAARQSFEAALARHRARDEWRLR